MDGVDKKTAVKKVLAVIGVIVFFLSFIPYLYLAVVAEDGIMAGLFGGPVLYGWDAVWHVFIWMCIIPVFPVCILYEVLFGILYIRKKHIALKVAAVVSALAVAAAIIIPCIDYAKREKEMTDEVTSKIEEYLSAKYGKEMAGGIKPTLEEYDSRTFHVTTGVLPEGKYFVVHAASDGEYGDDLSRAFTSYCEQFKHDFDSYLDKKYSMPSDMHIVSVIDQIGFDGYKYGDDYTVLFPKVTYHVGSIEVRPDAISQELLEALSYAVWNECCPQFEDLMYDSLMVYVMDDSQTVASIQIDPPSQRNGQRTVCGIDAYTNGEKEYGLIDIVFFLE